MDKILKEMTDELERFKETLRPDFNFFVSRAVGYVDTGQEAERFLKLQCKTLSTI